MSFRGIKTASMPHGTRGRYVGEKCRCDACREANRLYYHQRRARELELAAEAMPPPAPPSRFLSTPSKVDAGVPRTWTAPDGSLRQRVYRRACPGIGRKRCRARAFLRKDSKGGICEACRRLLAYDGAVDAAPVRAHLAKLSAAGVGYKTVADAADVSKTILQGVMAGRRTRMRRSAVQRVLEVTTAAIADAGMIPAGPTWELVDELLERGWTKGELARRLGSRAKEPALQIRRDRVLARTALAVERLYRSIGEPPARERFCACSRPLSLVRDGETWCARCDRRLRRAA